MIIELYNFNIVFQSSTKSDLRCRVLSMYEVTSTPEYGPCMK